MGNDSSKLQPQPANKVQRRLSTDSGRRYRGASPNPLPNSNSSISCSDGYLSPNCKKFSDYLKFLMLIVSNCSSRHSLSIENTAEMCRSRSGSASSERSNSLKNGQKHPIPLKNRQLIQVDFIRYEK
jgi:hypothetical protein